MFVDYAGQTVPVVDPRTHLHIESEPSAVFLEPNRPETNDLCLWILLRIVFSLHPDVAGLVVRRWGFPPRLCRRADPDHLGVRGWGGVWLWANLDTGTTDGVTTHIVVLEK